MEDIPRRAESPIIDDSAHHEGYEPHFIRTIYSPRNGPYAHFWSTGVVSTPAWTMDAVAFFLNSLIAPKNPSSPVVFGLASHSSSCLRVNRKISELSCEEQHLE